MHQRAIPYIALPFALVLFSLTGIANAEVIYYSNNATIKSGIKGSAIVGYVNKNDDDSKQHPTSPTIMLASGGHITTGLYARNSSKVMVKGGSIGGDIGNRIGFYDIGSGVLSAGDNSTVMVSNGRIEILTASDYSIVTVSGGSIGVYFHSGLLSASGHSTVSITGGKMRVVTASGDSTLTMIGGDIGDSLATVNKNGSSLTASENSIVNLRGGTITGCLQVNDNSTLNLFGMGLNKTLKEATTLSGYSLYTLTGKLSDGTDVAGKLLYVKNDSRAKVNFIDTSSRPALP